MNKTKSLTLILLAGMIAGTLICLWSITRVGLTTTESLLLSVVLTIFSIIGSWIASRYYSEISFNTNLRTFANKAAEKVTNLSTQLDRLSFFLQQELEETEFDSPTEALLSKNARIEGAVHIINTLKSVNDGSLSDWQGVIGEKEITAQREVQDKREETLREILERLDSVGVHQTVETHFADPENERLRLEVESIKNEMRSLAGQVSGVPIRRSKSLRKKQLIEKPCPGCGAEISWWQKLRGSGKQAVDCNKCGARLYSQAIDGDCVLHVRAPVLEEIICPGCAAKNAVRLDPLPGTSSDISCTSCQTDLLVSRANKDVRVKIKAAEPQPLIIQPGDEFIKRVGDLMGPQPWPRGQSKSVARELGVDHGLVSRAIQILVDRKVFKFQHNGKLYSQEETPDDTGVSPKI